MKQDVAHAKAFEEPAAGTGAVDATVRPAATTADHTGVTQVRASWAVPVAGGPSVDDNSISERLYRLFEIVVVLIGLIVTIPFMLLEALLIRLDSPGKPLFQQPRMGRSAILPGRDLKHRADLREPAGGYGPDVLYYVPRPFRFLKFRTMYIDARERFPELYSYSFRPDEFRRLFFKNDADPRVTRVGRYLRRLTIDELPNLWCVLIGDMRLVGPRPEIPEVLTYYSPEDMYKFSVKPGITGLAQISGRGLLSWGETLKWDLEYVRTRTIWLDLKIICKTLWLVVARHGAF
jgi:lipopolysaccharide/colanic/teichoic acid biosynthesis glycosyltransferase